jgi:hypothetical protein
MNLIFQGIGANQGVDEVKFKILSPYTTSFIGFAVNASDPKIEGTGKMKDYSFDEDVDDFEELGTLGQGQTTVDFWAKDYGGRTIVEVCPFGKRANFRGAGFLMRTVGTEAQAVGARSASVWR